MTEGPVAGVARRLVTVCLCDGPGLVDELGERAGGAPVVSHLRPSEARELTFELLVLAELAVRRTGALR